MVKMMRTGHLKDKFKDTRTTPINAQKRASFYCLTHQKYHATQGRLSNFLSVFGPQSIAPVLSVAAGPPGFAAQPPANGGRISGGPGADTHAAGRWFDKDTQVVDGNATDFDGPLPHQPAGDGGNIRISE
jgi:hypothetical protein